MTLTSPTWWCKACRTLHHPGWDALALPPGSFSWAVGECAAHLGALVPSYARSARSLAYLTGIVMSDRELEWCTEGLGAAYSLPAWPPATPPPPADVLYVEADAVMLHFREAKPWHEVKVFCTWRQTGQTPHRPRYWTAEGAWDQHLAALQTLTEWEGLETAKVVVSLGDGAVALWTLLTALAPRAVQVLDWFHVQEHLATVATVLPDGSAWHKHQRDCLKTGRQREVIHTLLHLARAQTTPTAIKEAARRCAGYLFRHRLRLNYAAALAAGYPIGSGRIESACKSVVQQRCKGPGMRWEHHQAAAVLQARCAWLNEDWPRACQRWRATGQFAPGATLKQAA